MSMNVFIVAERDVSFKKKNGVQATDVQSIKFDAWQTPTDVTYSIVNSANPAQGYIDFIKSRERVVQEPVFATDDIFGERDPIGFNEYNAAAEHIEEFQTWVASVEEQGYTVKFEVI